MLVDPVANIGEPHRIELVQHRRRALRVPPVRGQPRRNARPRGDRSVRVAAHRRHLPCTRRARSEKGKAPRSAHGPFPAQRRQSSIARTCRSPRSRRRSARRSMSIRRRRCVRHAEVLRKPRSAPLADPLIAYAVKANPNARGAGDAGAPGARRRHRLGRRISPRPRRRHRRPSRIVFSGVGKTEEEMALALKAGLYQFNLESLAEAEMLSRGRDRARASRRRSASGSIPTSPPAATPRSRPARAEQQVRHPIGEALAAYAPAARAARPRGAGRRRPYRQPADQPRSARDGLRAGSAS